MLFLAVSESSSYVNVADFVKRGRHDSPSLLKSNNKWNLRGGKLSRVLRELGWYRRLAGSEFTTSGKLRKEREFHFQSVAVQFIEVQGTSSWLHLEFLRHLKMLLIATQYLRFQQQWSLDSIFVSQIECDSWIQINPSMFDFIVDRKRRSSFMFNKWLNKHQLHRVNGPSIWGIPIVSRSEIATLTFPSDLFTTSSDFLRSVVVDGKKRS